MFINSGDDTSAGALFRAKDSIINCFYLFIFSYSSVIFPVHVVHFVQFFPLCAASRTKISFTILLSVSILRLHVHNVFYTRIRINVYI